MEQGKVPFELESYDGERLAGFRWPAAAPRGVLLLLHGYAEHAGRHEGLAQAAAAAGFDAWSFDQFAHGSSPGAVRGAVDGYESAIAATGALQERARAEAGDLPHFLFGHSMGGAIALRYALGHPERLAGLVLSAPFLRDAVDRPAFLSAAVRVVAGLFPSLPTTRVPPAAISRDPAEVRRYEHDPLNYHGGVRADAAATMLEQGRSLLARAGELAVDTLVVHGGEDQVAAVSGSRDLAAASARVELQELAGGYHELHHDSAATGVPERTRTVILGWLRARS